MKKFEEICTMSQNEVKTYMTDFLTEMKYENVVSGDGYLYAKGTEPVLLVAHMDTVHKKQCKVITRDGDKIMSPQGIGGDDRCGIFIIMNVVNEKHCSVLLCEDEEIGCVGAKKFVTSAHEKI